MYKTLTVFSNFFLFFELIKIKNKWSAVTKAMSQYYETFFSHLHRVTLKMKKTSGKKSLILKVIINKNNQDISWLQLGKIKTKLKRLFMMLDPLPMTQLLYFFTNQ